MTRQELYMQALEILSQEKKNVATEKIHQLMRENPEHESLLANVLESNDGEAEPGDQYWRYTGNEGRLSMSKKDDEFINKKIFEAIGFDAERHLNEKPNRGYVGRFIYEVDSNIEPGKKFVLFEWEANGQMRQAVYNKSKFTKVDYVQDEYDEDEDESYEESYSYSYDEEDDENM